MLKRYKLLSMFKCAVLCAKIFYDGRKAVMTMCGYGTAVRSVGNKFGKYLLISAAMVEVDNQCECIPEECKQFLVPPPERKMLLVANLKMNGSMKSLKQFCDCLNNSVACIDIEDAKTMLTRNYKKQLFPDIVDVVIAPPYPYLESVSSWLRKDCHKCRDCEGCCDCESCTDCIDCSDCSECKCNDCDECCANKCLNFCNCNTEEKCGSQSETSDSKKVCDCGNCALCKFCQKCLPNDCADCTTCIQTAAQNAIPFLNGGLSGEVNPRQVRELGGRWVIIGSSERRVLFQESDQLLVHKLRCALMGRMQVVYCVMDSCCDDNKSDEIEKQMTAVIPKIGLSGENNDSGNPHNTKFKWEGKDKDGYLAVLGTQDWQKVAIAYEPVWAYKSGYIPTPEEAEEKCCNIREIIRKAVNDEAADKVRILYGGPVDAESAPEYADQPSIDGFMIGTLSFKLDQLIPIANSWYIKNRQDISDLKLDLIPPPDACIKQTIKDKDGPKLKGPTLEDSPKDVTERKANAVKKNEKQECFREFTCKEGNESENSSESKQSCGNDSCQAEDDSPPTCCR